MIYLDNGATSLMKPQVVVDAVCQALTHFGNAGRGATEESLSSSRVIFEARMRLNELINGESMNQVAFDLNITAALNMAIYGLIRPGDHVITTVMEHNSVLRPLYDLQDRGVELSFAPLTSTAELDVEALKSLRQDNTKAVIMTHASNLTGQVNPVAEVGAWAKAEGLLFIVDAAQTAGAIPIDVQAMGIDVLCFTGHKSLLGPQGTGGLYVRPGVEIPPFKSGGTGVDTYNHHQPAKMPTVLEAGTMNGHGLAGLNAALGYLLDYGIDRIEEEERDLSRQLYQGLKAIPGLTIYGNHDVDQHCPTVTINIGDLDSSVVADILLEDYEIAIRSGGHCAPLMHQALGTQDQGAVRFSLGHFSTSEDVEAAIAAVTAIARDHLS